MIKFSKAKAMLMAAITGAPMMASTVTAVHADTVNNTAVKATFTANSVATIRQQMRDEGLNVNDVNGKYIVRPGDTVSGIAAAAHMSIAQVAEQNHLTNVDVIYIGQTLFLNANTAVKTTATPSVYSNTTANTVNNSIATGAITGNALAHYAGGNYVGTGNTVALPSQTTAQMHATALANNKVNFNNHANTNSHPAAKHDNNGTPIHHVAGGHTATTANKTQATHAHVTDGTTVTSHTNAASQAGNKHSAAASQTTAHSTASASQVSHASQATSATHSTASQTASQASQKPAVSQAAPAASHAVAPSAAPQTSQAAPSQASQTQAPSSAASQAPSQAPNYDTGVVNSNGTVNYQNAMNQRGPWDNMSSKTNTNGDSPASDEWFKDHPGAKFMYQGYADSSQSRTPIYAGDNSYTQNKERPTFNQSQCDQINQQIQQNINAPQTFGNGITWVSRNYNGQVTGTAAPQVDTPVATPYQNSISHTAQIDSNVIKQDYNPAAKNANLINPSAGTVKAPAGSKYVSSYVTQGQGLSADGYNYNTVHLTFYK